MLPELLKLVPYQVDGIDVSVAGAQTFEYDYGSPEGAQAVAKLLEKRRVAGKPNISAQAVDRTPAARPFQSRKAKETGAVRRNAGRR